MLGVLMLQTRFPRPPGDIGHPGSFAFPVQRMVVAGATPLRVVQQADARLLPGLQALVLECTNLPPCAAALRQASGLPVHDIVVSVLNERVQAAGRA